MFIVRTVSASVGFEFHTLIQRIILILTFLKLMLLMILFALLATNNITVLLILHQCISTNNVLCV